MEKVIHYCWFGGKPLNELTLKCINSWKKYLPEFEIKEWNEKNFDVNQCVFVKQAYEQKKWAFVADYARFKVLEEHGGMYLDTDMEITKDISKYLEHELFLGQEDSNMINAAVVWSKNKNNKHIKKILNIYQNAEKFNPTGDLFDQSVPRVLTNYFKNIGFDKDKYEIQILDNNTFIYPMEYFYPLSYDHQNNKFTKNSSMIHHFDATWTSTTEKLKTKLKRNNMKWAIKIIDMFLAIKRNISIKDLVIFMIPFIIFALALISYWPGIYTYDGNNQWSQVKTDYITDSHPFLSTYFMKVISNFWSSQTILVIFQIFLFSLIWTCICKSLRNKEDSIKIQIIYTTVISLTPIIFVYAITVWKDVIYSYSILSLILMLYIGLKKEWKYRILDLIIISIILIIIQGYRHNGIVISLVSFVSITILLFKNKVANKRKIIFVASFIGLIALFYLTKSFIAKPLNEESLGAKESIILFYTGALLSNNDISNEEELKYLNTIMPIDDWKSKYDPFLINDIGFSDTLNKEQLSQTFDKLLKICMRNSLENLDTILVHCIKSTSLVWNPYPLGYTYIFDFSEWGPDFYGFNKKVDTKFELGKNIFDSSINFTMKNKYIRNILYRPANALYLSILIIAYIAYITKNKNYTILLLPTVVNSMSYMFVNVAQDLRYVYINYLTLAFVILLLVSIKSKKCINKGEKICQKL